MLANAIITKSHLPAYFDLIPCIIVVHLALCLLGNFSFFLSSAVFFSKSTFGKNSFRNTIRVSISSNPDQTQSGSKLFAKVFTRRH